MITLAPGLNVRQTNEGKAVVSFAKYNSTIHFQGFISMKFNLLSRSNKLTMI
jgi:hypothetical protein